MGSSNAERMRKRVGSVPGVRRAGLAALGVYRRRVSAPNPYHFLGGDDLVPPPGRYADLYFAHTGLQSTKWKHYPEIYDQLLAPYLDGFAEPDGSRRPLRFLEIGVRYGGSLEIWREYLAPDSIIYGVDVDPRCKRVERPGLPIRIGSQADPAFLASVIEEMGGVDVVLDDGSHVNKHQLASFDVLFPLLSDGGLYIVEDTCTSYWAKFGGGYRRPGTMVETAKGMVDGLAKSWFRAPVGRRAQLAHRSVHSIQFFDSVVAFRKGPREAPVMTLAGDETF